jgi:cytidylate kinase
VVVAIDGPSGSGKSSTSRGVARRLGLRYLDTGAMYRAMTWWMLRHDVPVDDPAAVASRCAEPTIESGTDPVHPTITVDGFDVAAAIRTPEVTGAVSAVSAVPQVRARLLLLQREAIDGALRDGTGIVVEGRDIGSVVWPQARPKVYLTASASARAARRAGELHSDLAAVAADIDRRDRLDSSRATSPLVRPEDAVELDTSELDIDEVVQRLVDLTAEYAHG